MKKIFAILLALISVTSFASCDLFQEEALNEVLPLPVQDDYSEYDFPDYSAAKKFSNVEQYANMQGYYGWYYCYGSTDDALSYMVYDPYSGAYRADSELISYIQKDEWQPSNETEIMACFKVPKKGTVTVEIDVELIYEQGDGDDGVSFYCLSSLDNETAFWAAYLLGSRPAAKTSMEVEVKAGEVLYFVMNANEGRYNDLTRVFIDVYYGGK